MPGVWGFVCWGVGGGTGEMAARRHMGADGLGGLAGLKVTW